MIDWVTVLTRVLNSIVNTAQLVLRGEASAQEALDTEYCIATIVAVMPGSWNGNAHYMFKSFENSKKENVIDRGLLDQINDELTEDAIEHEANPHPYDRYFAADCDSEVFNRMFPRQRRDPELFVRRIRPEEIQAQSPPVVRCYECPSPDTFARMTPAEVANERRKFIRIHSRSSASEGTSQELFNEEEAREEVTDSTSSTEGASNNLLDNHLDRPEGARDRPSSSSHHDHPSVIPRVAPRKEIDEKEKFHVALIDFRGNCAVCSVRDATGNIEKYGTCLGEVTSDLAGAVLRAKKESAKRRRRERRRRRRMNNDRSDFVRIRNELFMDSIRAEHGPY
ncbi:hypothetical protein OXX79_011262 [Metschnikowia pulcherrima]